MRISTRVPEKLIGKKYDGMRIYSDNKRLYAESDVLIICTPKYKSKRVLKGIKGAIEACNPEERKVVFLSKKKKKLIISIIGGMEIHKLNLGLGQQGGIMSAF